MCSDHGSDSRGAGTLAGIAFWLPRPAGGTSRPRADRAGGLERGRESRQVLYLKAVGRRRVSADRAVRTSENPLHLHSNENISKTVQTDFFKTLEINQRPATTQVNLLPQMAKSGQEKQAWRCSPIPALLPAPRRPRTQGLPSQQEPAPAPRGTELLRSPVPRERRSHTCLLVPWQVPPASRPHLQGPGSGLAQCNSPFPTGTSGKQPEATDARHALEAMDKSWNKPEGPKA